MNKIIGFFYNDILRCEYILHTCDVFNIQHRSSIDWLAKRKVFWGVANAVIRAVELSAVSNVGSYDNDKYNGYNLH